MNLPSNPDTLAKDNQKVSRLTAIDLPYC